MTNEKVDHLVEQLEEVGFIWPGMYDNLQKSINEGNYVIRLNDRRRYGDDEMFYGLTIIKDPKTHDFSPYEYVAILLRTHPVPHGTYEGLETALLEQRMKDINWNDYERITHLAGGKNTISILEDIRKLTTSSDPGAQDIAKRLQLRYWLNTPIEQRYPIPHYYDEYAARQLFTLSNSFSDIHTRDAYNLMCNRSVMKFELTGNRIIPYWVVLENGKLINYPDFFLDFKSLPIKELQNDSTGPSVIHGLIRGERMVVHLVGIEADTAYIEADPRNQTFAIYDKNLVRLDEAFPGLEQLKARPANALPDRRKIQPRKGNGHHQ
ncbi:hypothetical protein [Dinghuibacter silviterrae]|uniref:Uncharacterized protein n=1 Tax=Dinghuibacter silviterrae TaxID=1539049 RepID=A0A4R8DSY6_9BACT|nr:hypothetical protein [Dinghuibacter silviterrae]TDX00517.1 hypothetical protein EDB95_1542 [Dinghuibacter silviterrae]